MHIAVLARPMAITPLISSEVGLPTMLTLAPALSGLIEAVAFLIIAIFLMRLTKPIGSALTAYAQSLSEKRLGRFVEQVRDLTANPGHKLTADKKRRSR